MRRKFVKVYLLPKYKANAGISNVFFSLALIATILFVGFYNNYVPYVEANENLSRARFDNQIAMEENSYYKDLTSGNVIDGKDVIYNSAISYVESTKMIVTTKINNIVSNVPNGAYIDNIKYSLTDGYFLVVIYVESDDLLLQYEESLISISWVEEVGYTSSGPGLHEIMIAFETEAPYE